MKGLPPGVQEALAAVLKRHPAVRRAVLFGSRAKGVAEPSSDIDLALDGDLTDFQAEAIALELNDLPLPYIFDIKALAAVAHAPLREHVGRVGLVVFEAQGPGQI